jgi:hypothetical protein
MVMPRKICRERIKAKPYVLWNEFIDLLAMSDYEELTPAQRGAHLVFWYESEVQNGGHCQYLTNHGLGHLDELISALQAMSAKGQATLVIEIRNRLSANPKPPDKNDDAWADDVLGDVYDDLDRAFGKCRPSLMEALQKHLDQHEAEFILRTD